MATDEMGLRALLLDWYAAKGVHPAEGRRLLAALSGVSPRTIEKIEQSGSFRFPGLFRLALKHL